MLWFVFKPQTICVVPFLVVHGFTLVVIYCLQNVALQFFLAVFIVVSLVANIYRWVYLRSRNSIIAIRVQSDRWQIKTRQDWHEVTVHRKIDFIDNFLFIQFKSEEGLGSKYYASFICKSNLDGDLFRELKVCLKVRT